MPTHVMGGTVNQTGGHCGPWPASPLNYIYTPGYAAPVPRLGFDGLRRFYMGAVTPGYSSGPITSGSVFYDGVDYPGNSHMVWVSGATMEPRFGFTTGGTLYIGRNTANGGTLYCAQSGVIASGGLVASFAYSEVASPPTALTVVPGPTSGTLRVDYANPVDNGGSSLIDFTIQTATSLAGPWTTRLVTASGVNQVISVPPGSYYVRVTVRNGVGSSEPIYSATPVAPYGGGARFDGLGWLGLTTGKRYSGSAWVDLVTRKRYNGTAWVDISN